MISIIRNGYLWLVPFVGFFKETFFIILMDKLIIISVPIGT